MCTTKTYNKKEIHRILRKNGWNVERQTGSHVVYENNCGHHITITVRGCNKMIWQRLVKEYNLVI